MATSVKLPYVKKLEERQGVSVWLVDGAYVRSHINEEFTASGQHYHFNFIPEKEIWIDKGTKPDEWRFVIDHMLAERRLMAKGKSYEEALDVVEKKEREERRQTGDLKALTKKGKKLPNPKDVHIRLWKRLGSGVSVWLVNGRLVRDVFDIEFTEGGHEHVYEYVPQNELWIDDNVEEKERPFILLHELHERKLMENGQAYEKAHEESSKIEQKYRLHPDELHSALAEEGWV